jgi:Na+-driven multidrug efflux pump
MVSNLIGQGKANRIGVPIRKAIFFGFLVTAPILVLVVFRPEWVLSLFTFDATTIAVSVPSLLAVAVAIFLAIPGDVLVQAVYGTADTKATFGIELVLTVVLLVYVYVVALQLGLPLHFIWAAEILAWIIRTTLGYVWLKSQAWRRLEV